MLLQPLSQSTPTTTSLHSIVGDEKAIASLIVNLLESSGIGASELARRLGIKKQSVSQYKYGYRLNPSVKFLAKLVDACGGKIYVELPSRRLK